MPRVNPDILRWARETAGLTRQSAAEKLEIHEAHGLSPSDRLARLEAGEDVPSRPTLLRMAKQYRRPLLVFYMSAPPRKGDRGQDFRSLPAGQSGAAEALIDALIRDVRARQSMVRALLEDEDETEPVQLVGSARMSDGAPSLVASTRRAIGVSNADFRSQRTAEDAFALLRAGVEGAGIFVLLIGNLGSHHTALDVEAFRGFALADPIAPFIVINDQDHKSAWSFTLLHELAHLFLGDTGISGALADKAIERFCNAVASEFLLPAGELATLHVNRHTPTAAAAQSIGEFARARHLSNSMIAYRLYQADAITRDTWQQLSTFFRDQWFKDRAARRESARKEEAGPSYYVVRRHRLGRALLSLVQRTLSAGAVTPTKAGRVLGVKPRNVEPLLALSSLPPTGRGT